MSSDPCYGGKGGGLMEIDSEPRVVFEFPMGSSRKVVAEIDEWRKKNYIDLRLYFLNGEGKWCPTKKGLKIHSDYVPDLRQAVEAFARALGQVDDQDTAA